MRRTVLLWVAATCTGALASVPDFDRDVRPILAEHCLECHSLDKAKGGLALVTRADATRRLKSGAITVVPGDAAQSELFKRVIATDEEEIMPPKEKNPLSAAQTAILKKWIDSGADWPAHWAYRPVNRPTPPELPGQAVTNPIDRFVLAKLKEAGLPPSPEADRITLIRRVGYDLLGLPPTPEEVDAFVADQSPTAYERMVDTALASPHFGERWGRHWLDMARYADSDGYEKDRPRLDAWRYRDWVIHAVNADMPFDQFTVEQLAGDLLPGATQEQLVATAFHRQTLTNTEGGADQEQFRVEAVFDRTETTGAVWLGLSVGCARCHTHKYDQITQTEYFQMFAFYNNGDEVTRQVPTSQAAWAEYERKHGSEAAMLVSLQRRLDEARAGLRAKMPRWEAAIQARLAEVRAHPEEAKFLPLESVSVTSNGPTKFKRLADGSWLAEGAQVPNEVYTVTLAGWDKPLTALRIEVLPDDSLSGKGPGRSKVGNFVLSEVKGTYGARPASSAQIVFHSPKADFEQKSSPAAGALDRNPVTGWGVQPKFGQAHDLTLQLARPLAAVPGHQLTLELHHNYQGGKHGVGRFRILGSSTVTEASIAPPEAVKVLNEEPLRRNDVIIKPLLDWMAKVDDDVVAADLALETARQRLPKAPLMDVSVIAERTHEPRATKVLHRGDFLSPTDAVKPGTLAVLPPPLLTPVAGGNTKATSAAVPDRLDFARWLVEKRNPLTPRVTVNHFWARLFGEGIVRTVNDFGVRGERPTHPELLDWLASEFMEQGWSRKKMLKLILMSATYRQSSVHREDLREIDPQNKLLARQNRLRVEGEIVRDLHLAASGLLSPKVGGPSVFPPMPPDVADLSYANNFKWVTSAGEDRYRRGMYTFFKRTAPHPDLMTFDCPDANTANVKRTLSNTPLQALTTLNAEAFIESARALAVRVLQADMGTASDDERIARMFRCCVSRAPDATETQSLRALLADARTWYATHAEEARGLALGEHKNLKSEEVAAWTATARIVLNLDEFVTRE